MQNICEMKRNEAKIARAILAKHFSQNPFSSRYHQGWRGLSPFKDCVEIAALGTAGGKKNEKRSFRKMNRFPARIPFRIVLLRLASFRQ